MNLQQFIQILLVLHIAGGMSSLLTGLYNIINRKGGKHHKLSGKFYVWGMFSATLSGVLLAFLKDNQFLFLIGVFSFYLAFSGFRTLQHKSLIFKNIDIGVALITGIFAIFMITTGLYNFNLGRIIINPILIVFGAVSLVYSLGDLLLFFNYRKPKKHHWLFNHITRMMASYISAVTAFMVVNFSMLPSLFVWFAPSVVGSIIISMFIGKYKRKLKVDA